MLQSPFAFYRGAAAVMASDLATTPLTGIEVQACGDAHLLNFGAYGSRDRSLIFDVNDFDETTPAPWEWDVKRLATSLAIAVRERGGRTAIGDEAVMSATRSYRDQLARLSEMSALDVFYTRVGVDAVTRFLTSASPARLRAAQLDAMKHTSNQALRKLAVRTAGGAYQIVEQSPLVERVDPDALGVPMRASWDEYARTLEPDVAALLTQFRLEDFALKVVGVGSVGTRCFIALLVDDHGGPLFLQMKEALPSVLESYWRPTLAKSPAHRVVSGQRFMQAESDVFLGWTTGPDGRSYYVRQLRDMKGSLDIDEVTPAELVEYGALCGAVLAGAHARSGAAPEIDGYIGRGASFDRAVAAFARSYAGQNERDYETLRDAARAGRVPTE